MGNSDNTVIGVIVEIKGEGGHNDNEYDVARDGTYGPL